MKNIVKNAAASSAKKRWKKIIKPNLLKTMKFGRSLKSLANPIRLKL